MQGQQRVCVKPLSGRVFYLDLPSSRRAQALENDITLLGGVRHCLQDFSLEYVLLLILNVSFCKEFVYSKQIITYA